VEGLLYYSTTAWDTNPWTQPWIYDANGDGFMFYPPKDETIAFNPCDGQSNRLVPSIRWELLREGMEDYEYLWLLNEGDPQIGVVNEADTLAEQFIDSRTLFSRVPTDLYETRAAIAAQLAGPSAAKLTNRSAVAENETFHYLLIYHAGDTAHTVVISDTVPSATTVITATGSKSPDPSVLGQVVGWTVIVDSQEIVTLTIEAQGVIAGPVTNSATFSGTQFFNASAKVLVYTDRVYLPSVLRGN
jgi:hypothetical protein